MRHSYVSDTCIAGALCTISQSKQISALQVQDAAADVKSADACGSMQRLLRDVRYALVSWNHRTEYKFSGPCPRQISALQPEAEGAESSSADACACMQSCRGMCGMPWCPGTTPQSTSCLSSRASARAPASEALRRSMTSVSAPSAPVCHGGIIGLQKRGLPPQRQLYAAPVAVVVTQAAPISCSLQQHLTSSDHTLTLTCQHSA